MFQFVVTLNYNDTIVIEMQMCVLNKGPSFAVKEFQFKKN